MFHKYYELVRMAMGRRAFQPQRALLAGNPGFFRNNCVGWLFFPLHHLRKHSSGYQAIFAVYVR